MKQHWTKGAVALAAAGVLALGLAGTAQAQDDEEPTPVKGQVTSTEGLSLNPQSSNIGAHLLTFTSDEDEAVNGFVYCIDIQTPLNSDKIYQEGNWDESGVENLGLIKWVLHNSFPNVASEDLAAATGSDYSAWDDEGLAQILYAGTQAAIWHFSDGFELDAEDATGGDEATDAAVVALYDYLVGNATELEDPGEAMVEFGGAEEGELVDGMAGPFTVSSNVGEVTLSAEGGKIVDADGNEVTTLADGGEFYLESDTPEEESTVTVTGTAAYSVPIGRVFMATEEDVPTDELSTFAAPTESQRLILANNLEGEVSAQIEVTIEAAPEEEQPKLPVTGTSLTVALSAGAALLAGGFVLMTVMRRRRAASTWGE